MRSQRLEFVRRADEGQPGHAGDALGKEFGEAAIGIKPGADRGAALRQRIKLAQAELDPGDAGGDLRRIAGKLLAKRERRRILGVGAADLDDRRKRFGLARKLGVQMLQRRNKPARYFLRRGNMHRGRENIVRGLAHIDVIVGMDRRFGAARAAENLVGAIGDHLIDVHVALGAGASLIDRQREMIIELAVEDFLRRLDDRSCPARIDEAKRAIGLRRGALDDGERHDQRARHYLIADRKIMPRALGLGAPIAVGRHFDRAE